MNKCHGCGVEKDPNGFELYPFHEDNVDTEEPVPSLLYVDCQPTSKQDCWRRVTVCHRCFHRLEPDMWISQRCWESIEPVTPFESLPCLAG